MFELLGLIAAGAAAIGGFSFTRGFVRRRLRYVDKVQRPTSAILAGGAATVIAAPVVALLPIVGAGTALLFGLGVGTGTRAGVKDIREGNGAWLPDH